MELDVFFKNLETQFKDLPFIESWTYERTNTTLKIKVILKRKSFLHIFFNAMLRIQSFALVINEERVWGLDRDNRLGWHEHPLGSAEKHISVDEQSIEAIFHRLDSVWNQIHN